jgi:hypothetical protein
VNGSGTNTADNARKCLVRLTRAADVASVSGHETQAGSRSPYAGVSKTITFKTVCVLIWPANSARHSAEVAGKKTDRDPATKWGSNL